ncbi:MAG TPA: hypothetical protein VFR86_18915 [Burkholderiaceae bacterium]|nr:hypothetical protein [Burkholderiaceae bacterium]
MGIRALQQPAQIDIESDLHARTYRQRDDERPIQPELFERELPARDEHQQAEVDAKQREQRQQAAASGAKSEVIQERARRGAERI